MLDIVAAGRLEIETHIGHRLAALRASGRSCLSVGGLEVFGPFVLLKPLERLPAREAGEVSFIRPILGVTAHRSSPPLSSQTQRTCHIE
jgi:hypothetical protein